MNIVKNTTELLSSPLGIVLLEILYLFFLNVKKRYSCLIYGLLTTTCFYILSRYQ